LEKKLLIKKGKYIKVGSRSIESWIKQLPDPTNDEQILYFQNELHHNYEITLEQYVNMYVEGIDCNNTTLDVSGEELLTKQGLWISPLKQKLHYLSVDSNFARKHFYSYSLNLL